MEPISGEEKINIITEIVKKVDQKDRYAVLEYIESNRRYFNQHSWEVLRCFCNLKYKDLDNYLKTVLLNTHVAWFCYMDDPDFLEGKKKFFEIEELNPEEFMEIQRDIEFLSKNYPMFRLAYDKLESVLSK